MKTLPLIISLLLTGLLGQTSQAKSFKCFSKYYTANQFTIAFSADIASNTVIRNFKMVDQGDGFNFSLRGLKADPNYKPKKYVGYNLYSVGANPGGVGYQSISMLLPINLTDLNGRFDAYVSDANADGEGSDGYFRALCSVSE
jgi:hypothetical protein